MIGESRKNKGLLIVLAFALALFAPLLITVFPSFPTKQIPSLTRLESRIIIYMCLTVIELVAVLIGRLSVSPRIQIVAATQEDSETLASSEPSPAAAEPVDPKPFLSMAETDQTPVPPQSLQYIEPVDHPIDIAARDPIDLLPIDGLGDLQPADSELLQLCDSSPHIYCVVEFSGRIVEANEAAKALHQTTGLDRAGASWYDVIHSEDQYRTAMAVSTLLAGNSRIESFRNRVRTGTTYRWMEWTAISKYEMRRIYIVGQDVTDFQDAFTALRDSELRFRVAFNSMHEGMVLVDDQGRLSLANERAQSILNLTPADVAHRIVFPSNLTMIREDGSPLLYSDHPLAKALSSGQPQSDLVVGFHGNDGEIKWIESNAVPLFHQGDRTPYAAVSTLSDVTDSREIDDQIQSYLVTLEFQKEQLEVANARLEEANHQLQTLATTDAITGLRNHRAFQERLVEEIMRAERYKTPLSLILLDVDQFKAYNDSFGHPAGDEVLRRLADILRDHARTHDLAARYGGEEFILLTPHTDIAGAEIVAERCRHAIERVNWSIRPVTASFGVASMGYGIETGAELIACADHALYAAKAAGRNRVSTYSPALGKTGQN
jgi:diguanylate cyclase (GGDEF)-like protein/PAS domain S-box-containing protein